MNVLNLPRWFLFGTGCLLLTPEPNSFRIRRVWRR